MVRRMSITSVHDLMHLITDDVLGDGSVQDSGNTGEDQPFWDALNANVKNLHAVISGHGGLYGIFAQCHLCNYVLDHGNEWCAREPTKDVIFCFDKHSGCVRDLPYKDSHETTLLTL